MPNKRTLSHFRVQVVPLTDSHFYEFHEKMFGQIRNLASHDQWPTVISTTVNYHGEILVNGFNGWVSIGNLKGAWSWIMEV